MERYKPGPAAVLSLLIPGVGQIYNGDFLRGIFWLIITPGFWIGTAGLFGCVPSPGGAAENRRVVGRLS
jgi:TM2 domain-containing membrane protein YozV